MPDAAVNAAVEAWLADPAIAEEDQYEIRRLQAAGNDAELTDRFYRDLEFGTGGLRGIIGAGLNRMNVYTVGAAAQGLANYIAQQGDAAKQAGVAIAYDCRRFSDAFARRAACVMAGNGIAAYLFESLRPTPVLSFAVRHLGCTSGIVVTASHNPPQYNGFKAYWTDGGQVVPPHDDAIIAEVRRVGGFGNVRSMEFDEARSRGLVQIIGRDVDEPFLKNVEAAALDRAVCRQQGGKLKIVYTPLHGTGGVLIPEALRRLGFQHVLVVPEQAKPDGDFPTVTSPNPEEGAALKMAIELAQRERADLVIGTDPDADRVGLAVRRPDGGYDLVTGNRIGALLTYYICEQLTRQGRFPRNAVMLTTIVSSDLMKTIARSYGAEVVEVLTGFKWIAEKVHTYDVAQPPSAGDTAEGRCATAPGRPSKQYIFGCEESYGYMPATFTRDKDAVTSTAFIAEAAAWAASQGKTLGGLLDDLFRRFGYHEEGAKNVTMPGKEGADAIKHLMDRLRTDPPKTFAGCGVAAIGDVSTGEIKDARTGRVIGRYDLPPSDVLLFTLDDGTKVIARPSGTEPKIKFYILVREPGDDSAGARREAAAKIEAIGKALDGLAWTR
jgi:phosphoglucomutase